jgi:hypothetical protein
MEYIGRMQKGLIGLGMALILVGCAERKTAYVPQAQPMPPPPQPQEVVVTQPPPAPQVEVIPATPGPAYVWVPGYWAWNGSWIWVGGRWTLRPTPHAFWIGGHWAQKGNHYVWHHGRWR